LGLLRRLGLARAAERVARRIGRELPSGSISWDDVEMLPGSQRIQLKVPSDKMAELHPADLAEIVSQLNRPESDIFLEQLDVKTLADTLEEVEPDFQASLVEAMPDEKVADVLEEMAPDAAADLLAELPEDRSQDLLNLMQDEEAKDVRKLLAYPDDSAGGIMTPEYIEHRPVTTLSSGPTGGVIAAWTYQLLRAEPAIDAVLQDFYRRVLGPYWPAERRWVDAGYQGMPFPFDEIAAPVLEIRLQWQLADLLAYLGTWSASRRLMQAEGRDPMPDLGERLAPLWGAGERGIVWPIALRVGRV
jgi:hypothetical protein